MADLSQPLVLQIDGIKDIRRLSAALEQYNAKADATQAQYEACAADYKATREQIAKMTPGAEGAERVISILRGDPVGPRDPSQPISALEAAAQEAAEAVHNQKSAIRVLGGAFYVGGVEWVQDVARLVRDAATAIRHLREETTPADTTRQSPLRDAVADTVKVIQNLRAELDRARVVAAADFETIQARDKEIDALRSERGLMQHSIDTWRGRANDLQQKIDATAPREPEVKLIAALKERLAAANATISELARDNTELREEVAAAEAFAAKTKPFIEAARAGHVYAAFGQWVIPEGGEGERVGNLRSIRVVYNVGDLKCL